MLKIQYRARRAPKGEVVPGSKRLDHNLIEPVKILKEWIRQPYYIRLGCNNSEKCLANFGSDIQRKFEEEALGSVFVYFSKQAYL